MAVHHIPDGYHSVTPYLVIGGAAKAIEFYKQAFGAVEQFRMPMQDGGVAHAEIKIGDSHIMLSDEWPDEDIRGPKARGGTTVSLMLYVEDCDKTFHQAVAAGAKAVSECADQFWGDRMGKVEDPFGHVWSIATHKEELSPDEIARRADEWMKQCAASA